METTKSIFCRAVHLWLTKGYKKCEVGALQELYCVAQY